MDYRSHFKSQAGYDNYIQATKGLDKDLAWKALDGGQGFDLNGGDMQRYNALVKERDSKAAASQAKSKAQAVKAQPAPQPKPQPAPQPKPAPQQNYSNASEAYFSDAQKRHGNHGHTAASLKSDYDKQTAGLDKELAFQALDGGRQFGESDKARYDKLVAERAKAKSKAQQVAKAPKNVNSNNNNQTATNTGDIEQKTEIKNTQTQNVTQDNDINTTINGDNNKVFNEQDNSIRQYGGDNRSLVINEANTGNQKGSGGGYYNSADKAITMGTLGGFYSPDDSPAGQAKFVDQAQTMNRDAQKRYSNVGVTTAAKYAGLKAGKVDVNALQRRIDGNEQYFRDRATVQEMKTYGDRAAKFRYEPFEFGDPIEEVKSNAADIARGYRDDIDDM